MEIVKHACSSIVSSFFHLKLFTFLNGKLKKYGNSPTVVEEIDHLTI